MEKIIFDTDIGVDDAFALAYAVKVCKVIGVTTVFGNVEVSQAVKNAKLLLKQIDCKIQVYKGCSRPLAEDPSQPAFLHGMDGLGDVCENNFSDQAPNALNFMIETLYQHKPKTISIVAVGPLTNIANLINQDAKIVQRIKKIFLMGGQFHTFNEGGNITPFGEFNIWKDPHAADQVMRSSIPVTILPLDVTHQVLLSQKDLAMLHPFLQSIIKKFMKHNIEKEKMPGVPLHDALTIAYIHNPKLFKSIESPVRVVTQGFNRGQTLRSFYSPAPDYNPFAHCAKKNICIKVESEKVKKSFIDTMKFNH